MTTFLLASAAEHKVNILRVPLDELIIGTVAFLLVFFALAKFAFPRISKTLDERADAIEGGIKRAQESQDEAAALLESYKTQLADARAQATVIRNEAQAEKATIIEQAKGEATAAAAALTERASAAIDAERTQAITSLRRDVGDLALTLASKVVGETLQDDAKARATVDRFIAELEAQAAK